MEQGAFRRLQRNIGDEEGGVICAADFLSMVKFKRILSKCLFIWMVFHLDIKAEDIHPSEEAWVIMENNNRMQLKKMKWGFLSSKSNQLMINARAETAIEKRFFCESVLKRRCVIPARHFYEWDRSKTKVTFSYPQSPVIYLAGFYRRFEEEERFIILTTDANASMKPVHDRMPLIFQREQIKDWICNDKMVRNYLKMASPMLERQQEYEQLTLF